MRHRFSLALVVIVVTAALCFWLPVAAHAQQAAAGALADKDAAAGYTVREGRPAGGGRDGRASSKQDEGPVRLARFSFVQGRVMWRAEGAPEEIEPSSDAEWSAATINLPLRPGAQIWVADGGRAEIQFDDGSLLRLGDGALVTLRALLSDANGAFTDLALSAGLVSLRPRHEYSGYRLNTPLGAISAAGPARIRIGVERADMARTVASRGFEFEDDEFEGDSDITVEIAVRSGRATVEGRGGEKMLEAGDYLKLRGADTSHANHTVRRLPPADSWERWNDERDRQLAAGSQTALRYLPPNLALVAGDLDSYGSWRRDDRHGYVWCPREQWTTGAPWQPYHHGRWTWVEPFGWTWVSSEPWGWAPYHYGTWIHRPYGWAWVPGPASQYWCPALVHFSELNGIVSWVPLAPTEIVYPSIFSIGFGHGHWWSYFSIGRAAAYYPTYPAHSYPGYRCIYEARPYPTAYINKIIRAARRENIRKALRRANRPGRSGRSAEPEPRPAPPRDGLPRGAQVPRPGALRPGAGEPRPDVIARGTDIERASGKRSGEERARGSRPATRRSGDSRGFVPVNARTGGAITARVGDFNRGEYQPTSPDAATVLARGQSPAAPPVGEVPVAGPQSVPPPDTPDTTPAGATQTSAPQMDTSQLIGSAPPGDSRRSPLPRFPSRRSSSSASSSRPAREPRAARPGRDAPPIVASPVVPPPPATEPVRRPRHEERNERREERRDAPRESRPREEAPRDAQRREQQQRDEQQRQEAQREEARRQEREAQRQRQQEQRQERREERREEKRNEQEQRGNRKNPPQNDTNEDNDGKRPRRR